MCFVVVSAGPRPYERHQGRVVELWVLRYGRKTSGYFRGINLVLEILRKVGNEHFQHEVSQRTAKGNANNSCFLEKGEHVGLISRYVGF